MGGPKPLSTGQIETFRRVFEIPDRDDFHYWMRVLDDIWLTEDHKRSEAARPKK
jgi:hypothetical protein